VVSNITHERISEESAQRSDRVLRKLHNVPLANAGISPDECQRTPRPH